MYHVTLLHVICVELPEQWRLLLVVLEKGLHPGPACGAWDWQVTWPCGGEGGGGEGGGEGGGGDWSSEL